jgi:hypothetical protein
MAWCLIKLSPGITYRTNLMQFCNLFNNAVSNSVYIASKYWKKESNELKRIWKEAAMALFKWLSQNLRGVTEENYCNSQ